MLRFVDVAQAMPDKRTPDARRRDFQEIYAEFSRERAAEQAARCSQCGVPFCQTHCPLQNNIPDWLKLTAEGRLEDALAIFESIRPTERVDGPVEFYIRRIEALRHGMPQLEWSERL